MTTALEGVRGQHHAPTALYPRGKNQYPLYRRLGGPQGRYGQVWKISPPPRFDPQTVQPVASRYTDYVAWPTDEERVELCSICLYVVHRDNSISMASYYFSVTTWKRERGLSRITNELLRDLLYEGISVASYTVSVKDIGACRTGRDLTKAVVSKWRFYPSSDMKNRGKSMIWYSE